MKGSLHNIDTKLYKLFFNWSFFIELYIEPFKPIIVNVDILSETISYMDSFKDDITNYHRAKRFHRRDNKGEIMMLWGI